MNVLLEKIYNKYNDDVLSADLSHRLLCGGIEFFEKIDIYNYVTTEDEIVHFIDNLLKSINNWYGPKKYLNPLIDPNAEEAIQLLKAIFVYVFYECPKERKNMKTILKLIYSLQTLGRNEIIYSTNMLFLDLKLRNENHPVFKYYDLPKVLSNNENAYLDYKESSFSDSLYTFLGVNYIKFEIYDICLKIIDEYFWMFHYELLPTTAKNDKEIVLDALKFSRHNVILVSDELKSDREFILEAVKYGLSTHQLSKELQDDKEVIYEAVIRHYDTALYYASDETKDDKVFILELVKKNGYILEYISDRLKDDEDVVLEAIKNDGNIKYASEKLRDNKEILLIAVTKSEFALEYASDRLKDDKEVVLRALDTYPIVNPLRYASKRLRDDVDVVKKAVKVNKKFIEEASKRIQNNPLLLL